MRQANSWFFILFILITGCQKDIVIETIEDKLTDKVWHLERKSGGQANFIYTGQPTFSFQLTKNGKAYIDTDGIAGTYTIDEQSNLTTLQVTANSRQIEAYTIRQVEKNYVVMEYSRYNIIYTLYFSTRL